MSVPRSSSSSHCWWKWETKLGRWRGSCGLLQVIALREHGWHGKKEKKKERTSQPFKVPASEVEMGLSKSWPLLAAIPDRKHSTVLMTRCLVSLVWRMQVEGFFRVQAEGNDVSDGHAHAGSAHTPLLTVALLFHSITQHLISRNKHNADDESHGKGADQALAHTRLSVLLRWMDWSK